MASPPIMSIIIPWLPSATGWRDTKSWYSSTTTWEILVSKEEISKCTEFFLCTVINRYKYSLETKNASKTLYWRGVQWCLYLLVTICCGFYSRVDINNRGSHDVYTVGHEWIIIFNIWTFFNFQFQMFKCLLTPTQWVFNSLINLCSDNVMVKTSNRYLPLLTYSNKRTFCIKFAHKSGINTINKCLEAKIYWQMLHKLTNIWMFQHLFMAYHTVFTVNPSNRTL